MPSASKIDLIKASLAGFLVERISKNSISFALPFVSSL
jgi:hypothetical protein